MQTTLLGLAIALILALVAAIVAPLVVDWNHYRAPIEAEASRLTGLSVHVNGPIDARLLPSPQITLRDVDVGGAGQKPQMRAGVLKLELALGPLLRGKVQAIQADLIKPQLSLGLDRSGAIDLPKLSPSFHPQALSISHFSVTDGRVTLSDAGSGKKIVLHKLWFNGDVVSFAGPFNGQGAAVAGDQLYGYRIIGSPAAGGGTTIRLSVDPSDIPLTTEFDGKLSFVGGVPHFDGTMALARPVGAALANGKRVVSDPWRVTGAVKATPAAAAISRLAFRYGPEERAVNFTGAANLSFGAQPHLAGTLSAMQVDVDRALAAPQVTDRPPLVLLKSFLQDVVTAAKLPFPARIGLRIDALTIGGATLESLSGDLDCDLKGWRVDKFHFHAPGLTDVDLAGRLTGSPQGFTFSGPATLASADFEALLKWLDGSGGNRAAGDARTFTAHGDITIASDRMAVEGLDAALDQEKITGSLGYQWPSGSHRARLDAELRAQKLDLDAFSAFAKSAGGDGFALPQQATLALDVDDATFAGVDARAVAAQVKYDSGTLQIDRLSVGDLAGARLAMSGRIDELSSQPRGRITLDLDASALDGLSDVAAKFVPERADVLRHVAARLAPAQVHAVLSLTKAATGGSTAELKVNGNLAVMRLALDGRAKVDLAHLRDAGLRLDGRLDTDDGSALVALLGLDHVVAVDQFPGELTLTASGPLNGDVHVAAKVAASGLDSTLAGTLHLTGRQTPFAALQLQAAAGDLRPLHQALTGQPGLAVPVSARAALAVTGTKWSFSNIAATVGKSSLQGNLAVDWTHPTGLEGNVDVKDASAPSVIALLLGLPTNAAAAAETPSGARAQRSGASWSSRPFGSGAFGGINGTVNFKLEGAAFTPALIAPQIDGVVHFDPSAIAVDHIDGRLAGGRLSGSLSFNRNADGLSAHTAISLSGATAQAIIGPSLDVTDGRMTLQLSSDGFGASPAALISSLQGNGTATLDNVAFAGLDAAAFTAARQAAGKTGPIDIGKVKSAVSAALANGRLIVPQGNMHYTVTSGALDLDSVTLKAADGPELSISGAVDLVAAAIDGRMTLSEAAPADALIAMRPALSVDIKGPIASPQRRLDTSALTSWLTLSAAELQTRRIESMEAGQHQGAAGQDTHPASPDVHSLSPGTIVETAVPAKLMTAPVAGAGGIERLQPQPVAPPLIPGANGSAVTPGQTVSPGVAGPMAIRPNGLRRSGPRGSAATAGVSVNNQRPAVPRQAGSGITPAE
ncbi:MAG: AsmA family protein [Xanthobacteraceae bacterium]